jgi:hypothetical protein
MDQSVQIDVFYPLPEGWGLCLTCEAMRLQAGLRGEQNRLEPGDYPQEYLDEVARLTDWVTGLAGRYGGCVIIRIHDARSPRTMWKALRYGVHRYPAFVIDGKRRVTGWDLEMLEERVAQAIGETTEVVPTPSGSGDYSRSLVGGAMVRLRRLASALGQMFYGMTIYEMVRDLHKERGSLERLFVLITFGDMMGVPVLPPYYTLRLLPYVVPSINGWKHSLMRERDLTDLCDAEIT